MNKQTIKSYIGIVIGLILSFNVGLYAWNGLQADNGDKLSVAKWNEMTSGVWGRFGAAMFYDGGNVGIGTSAPSAKLEISSCSNCSLRVGITSNMANAAVQIKSTLGVLAADSASSAYNWAGAWNYYNNGNSPSWAGTIVGYHGIDETGNVYGFPRSNQGNIVFQNVSNGIISSNGADIHISPFGTPAATFLKNGNVGIGTTTPTRKLSIEQSSGFPHMIELTTKDSAGAADIAFYAEGVPYWAIGVDSVNRNLINNGALHFYNVNIGTALLIDDNGNVGIGTVTPQYKLDVNGQIRGTNLAVTSDQRYKKDIKTIESPLDKISKLRGVTFNWKTGEFKDKNFPKGNQVGFIAQEVEKVLPQIVTTDTDGYKSVQYSNITAVLVEAVKEQQKQIKNLVEENNNLKIRVDKLENK